jgi:hypothetical protein
MERPEWDPPWIGRPTRRQLMARGLRTIHRHEIEPEPVDGRIYHGLAGVPSGYNFHAIAGVRAGVFEDEGEVSARRR